MAVGWLGKAYLYLDPSPLSWADIEFCPVGKGDRTHDR